MSRITVIPFGPQHPVLPEPIQLRLELKDEKVVSALPVVGYVHRGLEKLVETKDYLQTVYITERVCGICSFIHSVAYCQGIETIMGVEVPPRARYLRVIWSETHRLHSHLLWFGLLADSFGFENLFMQIWRAREAVLDLQEATAGARVILGTCCVGGVRRDLDQAGRDLTLATLDKLEQDIKKIANPILKDYGVQQRTVGIGRISRELTYERGAVGPTARAAGIAQDLRQTGYAAYGELDFQPVVETAGDCYARLQVRVREMNQSIELILRALERMPASPISVPVKGNPDGETVSRVEQPRGEVVYYL
ncbi:MAG: nickel-dependent hydrogenase large subunit, partial [Proteobacteria bacterium]|nr:nickel-dependent hydrogenase large subunit [Pseudomonadota bacterium]